jgi:hypothetical protein
MKTAVLASLLAALSLSLSACATDESYPTGGGLRPGYKPSLDPNQPEPLGGNREQTQPNDAPDIDETLQTPTTTIRNPGLRDPRLNDWAEDVVIQGKLLTQVHHIDPTTGLDIVEIVDDGSTSADDTTCCVNVKLHAQELDIDGLK